MSDATNLIKALRELTEEERRFVFRELAKDLLDPNAEELAMFCDNEGNILGYFESSLLHLRSTAEKFPEIEVESKEEFMEGSLTLREFLARATPGRESNEE